MGFTRDLLEGLAQLLDSATVAVWKPTGAYTEDQVGIVIGVPTQSPRSLVALAAYGNVDDASLSDSTVQVQMRLRSAGADPGPADDLADEIFDALQGLRATLNGIAVVYAKRVSTYPLGLDGNGRQERTDNYDLTVHRPSTHRE